MLHIDWSELFKRLARYSKKVLNFPNFKYELDGV